MFYPCKTYIFALTTQKIIFFMKEEEWTKIKKRSQTSVASRVLTILIIDIYNKGSLFLLQLILLHVAIAHPVVALCHFLFHSSHFFLLSHHIHPSLLYILLHFVPQLFLVSHLSFAYFDVVVEVVNFFNEIITLYLSPFNLYRQMVVFLLFFEEILMSFFVFVHKFVAVQRNFCLFLLLCVYSRFKFLDLFVKRSSCRAQVPQSLTFRLCLLLNTQEQFKPYNWERL